MEFVAETSYQLMGIAPWLSDWGIIFGSYGASFPLTDETTGTLVATAPCSQYYNSHGTMGLVLCQFPSPVSLVAGHTYSVPAVGGGAGMPITTLIRGVNPVSPVIAGPGFSSYWWGGVFNSDFTAYRVLDYAGPQHITSPQGIGGVEQTAVRFVAGYDETLQSISVKLKSAANVGVTTSVLDTYPPNASGTPVYAALYSDNPSSSSAQPGTQLAIEEVDSGTFGQDGWLTVPGFDYPLVAGTAYWFVWSAPAAASVWILQRDVSPYRFYQVFSDKSGASGSWYIDGQQGPTEVTFRGITSAETIGNPFDDGASWAVSATDMVAQPFMLTAAATVNAIYAEGGGSLLEATIYEDNGAGTGPNMATALASGSFNGHYQYVYSGAPIVLGTPVQLAANTKYWIVFSSTSSGDVCVANYWERPADPSVPEGYEALASTNGGSSWTAANSAEVASVVFMIGVVPSGVSPTPVPTTLTLTAEAL
jgi:hypothetical protein